MWIDIAFQVTLQSPFVIKRKRNEQFPETLGYIPGSTLRGALASSWIRRHGLGDDFYRLFSQGQQRYPFLYPGSWQSSPYPLTAVSCKRQGGFQKHGVEDLLCYYAKGQSEEIQKRHRCNYLLGGKSSGQASTAQKGAGAICGEDRKPYAGYVYAYEESRENPPRVRYRSRMGVGIEATTGSAADGILYGRSAVDDVWPDESEKTEGRTAVFAGLGRIEECFFEKLQKLCEAPLFLGSERSRGFGQIKMTLTKQPRPTLESRVKNFQKTQGDGAFAILLRSPAILLDRYLRNHLNLEKALDGVFSFQETPYQHVKPAHIATWNAIHRIPKDDEYGIAAGSVLYGRSNLPFKDLLIRLQELEEQGIGERREEGFGQVIVCSPLHLPVAI